MTQKLLTVTEVGKILDLKPARIYELTRERKIPFVQIGERQYRYSEAALMRWIDNGGNKNSENAEEVTISNPGLADSRYLGGQDR
ncbi:MAG: helix-turn-helix domain-containing protein [Pyrinomonadaceae bacterium]|nr:helix-turn-helix domain-containing protein [Pyrinomonadaceae bacterium]